jgi:hypothetical protein
MPWEPLPHEADLFVEVYIDESSQTKHRYLVLGGLVVPMDYIDRFDADIIAARGADLPIAHADGSPRIIKWEKAKGHNLAGYKRVVDAYFYFVKKHNLPIRKHCNIHCIAVDTTVKAAHDRKYSGGDIDIGFNKELYFLCVKVIAPKYPKALFHVYPDRRSTKQKPADAQKIMNFGMRKYGDTRDWPFRRVQFGDPERSQALQVVDIIIGALAFKLNGHYDNPSANKSKKELCDHVLRLSKINNVFEGSKFYQKRVTIFPRTYTPYTRKR